MRDSEKVRVSEREGGVIERRGVMIWGARERREGREREGERGNKELEI